MKILKQAFWIFMFMGLMVPHDAYPTSMFEGRSTKFDTARKITNTNTNTNANAKANAYLDTIPAPWNRTMRLPSGAIVVQDSAGRIVRRIAQTNQLLL